MLPAQISPRNSLCSLGKIDGKWKRFQRLCRCSDHSADGGKYCVAEPPPLRGVLSAFRILDSIAPDDQTTQDSESNHPEKISLTKRNEKMNKINLANNSKLKLFGFKCCRHCDSFRASSTWVVWFAVKGQILWNRLAPEVSTTTPIRANASRGVLSGNHIFPRTFFRGQLL